MSYIGTQYFNVLLSFTDNDRTRCFNIALFYVNLYLLGAYVLVRCRFRVKKMKGK